ncbi:hypothetical protein QLS91_09740 [Flavobacterium sp. LB2P84]|uniref:Plantaricin C family lantibiotic n=1 Tax=Flavobacterium yafengii TaxID=3041253 RepID=A0AAW6TS15_9FLAO|nr:hypothetical protein [Flavobacterium yafengii]MDI5950263.1 hypothetical protein [Flavobacterium yafengii]MDI6033354.1 hypothetical protein [Flavobacterium yafengii]
MLKNRLKELSKKGDNFSKVEIIKDAGLMQIRGGLTDLSLSDPTTCGKLTTCGWNSDVCPNLTKCDWNG